MSKDTTIKIKDKQNTEREYLKLMTENKSVFRISTKIIFNSQRIERKTYRSGNGP